MTNSPLRRIGDLHPLRILLVEDNAVNQRLVLLFLQLMGFEADAEDDGAAAVEAVKRKHYDIVFMDVHMPTMDGFEAARTIVRETSPERLPVLIAMTAIAMQGDRERCLQAGMHDYISKPIDLAALEDVLLRWAKRLQSDNRRGNE